MTISTEDLKAWRRDAVRFAEETLYIRRPDHDRPEPLRLTPAQKTFITEATRREGDGWKYALAVASFAKQTGKTAACAVIALWRCCLWQDQTAVILSTTERQAKSTLFRRATDLVRNSPIWQGIVDCQTTRIVFGQTNSLMEVHPCEWAAIQGITCDVALLDEWAVSNDSRVGEMLLSQAHSGLGLVSSQLGPTGGPVYALKQIADEGTDPRLLFHYETDPILGAPWLTQEWLDSRKRVLPPASYAYMHRNQPGASANRLFTDQQLAACQVDYRLPRDRSAFQTLKHEWGLPATAQVQVAIGLDRSLPGSKGRSETVLAAVGRFPDGMYRLLALRRLPTGGSDEVFAALTDIERIVGRTEKRFETYQSSDIATAANAELVAATSQYQARTFGEFYHLVAEGKFEYPTEGAELLHGQLASFEIDTDTGALPRYSHAVGSLDDAVYATLHAAAKLAEKPAGSGGGGPVASGTPYISDPTNPEYTGYVAQY